MQSVNLLFRLLFGGERKVVNGACGAPGTVGVGTKESN